MSIQDKNDETIRFYVLLVLVVAVLGVGTVFYHLVEGFTLVDSFYFSVVTLGTVGYGDLYPVTEAGKLFTALYIIIGIGILIAFAEVFAKRVVSHRIDKIQQYGSSDSSPDDAPL